MQDTKNGPVKLTLFWSSRSPFVRKVMLAAHELGVADRIAPQRVNVAIIKPAAEVTEVNASGRIPLLLTPEHGALQDSRVICEYLQSIAGGAVLIPEDATRWRALAVQSFADALMEALVVWRSERERPDGARSDAYIEAYRRKLNRMADDLEGRIEALAAQPFHIGHVAVGVALSYVDFRFAAEAWREGRPKLATWHAAFCERPAARATEFSDIY